MRQAAKEVPTTSTSSRPERRVGVEFAFSALDPGNAAESIREMFGGETKTVEPGWSIVDKTGLGTFDIRCAPAEPGASGDEREKTHGLTRAAVAMLPTTEKHPSACEIRCPPVLPRQLPDIDRIYDKLRRSGRSVDQRALAVPLGFDLAVDALDLDAVAVGRILKAFCLLCDWLRQDYETGDIEAAVVFPKAYPLSYRTLVLNPGYEPDIEDLARDYLWANPDRDRELDLLPLLVSLTPQSLAANTGAQPVEPLAAYFFKLPRAGLAQGGGIVTDEWERWLRVEALGADANRLSEMAGAFLSHAGFFAESDWAEECARWLDK